MRAVGNIYSSFNSTMVRLKRKNFIYFINMIKMFQFHNGSIKTDGEVEIVKPEVMFQFHNGSIKTM